MLIYLNNDIINSSMVTYADNPNLTTVYNREKLSSFDAYEVYLDGATSFIEIKNTSQNNNKELIIFRDSFASSITPLLIQNYSKITLIDTRYITFDLVKNKIEFNTQDILFMYSTLLINNSFSLK